MFLQLNIIIYWNQLIYNRKPKKIDPNQKNSVKYISFLS